MQSEGIISNPLTQDIRLKGHQTIRFAPDGFSVLVADASYKPVFLQHHSSGEEGDESQYPAECLRLLEEHKLLDFEGETSIVVDDAALTCLPSPFFDEALGRTLLEKSCTVPEAHLLASTPFRMRNLHILFGYSPEIEAFRERLKGKTSLMHSLGCLLSLADQVQASDHQRGFVLIEVQMQTLNILVIREDELLLANRYALNDPSDFIYHTLNTMKQLKLDRESTPVYLSGIVHPEHELYGLLRKYIRTIKVTPYYLEGLDRMQLLRFMILSEASKCA